MGPRSAALTAATWVLLCAAPAFGQAAATLPVETLPPVAPPTPPSGESELLGVDGHPLAGWHNGYFFLRDRHDNFRLYLQGRLQVDSVLYFGPGVPESSLKDTIFSARPG